MSGVYLGDLIQILRKGFPVLPGMTMGDPKTELEQFYSDQTGSIQIVCDPLPEWSQGDIINSIPFVYFSENGELSHFTSPGMIVSSTCDLDRKEKLVLCPCFPLKQFESESFYSDLLKNYIFELFFIGRTSIDEEMVVDLGHPMTLRRERIRKNLELNTISRQHSLTQIGWYLFITKFSIKYLRPDDSLTMNTRT